MAKKYDASSIEVLEGLEGVKRKPAMYIGETDTRGVTHLLKEIMGNSFDETSNGYGDRIGVEIASNTFAVFDTGRGIPFGPSKKNRKEDTLTLLATRLHSGGKLSDTSGNYSTSIGTHGVGLAVVNALSSKLTIWSIRDGKIMSQTFKNGDPVTDVRPVKSAPTFNGEKWPPKGYKTGTVVQWEVNLSLFDKGTKVDAASCREWLQEISWFITPPKAKKITQIDYVINGKSGTILRKDLSKYIDWRIKVNGIKTNVMEETINVMRSETCDFIGAWTENPDYLFQSACNSNVTKFGGTHETGALNAIEAAFKDFASKKDKFRQQDLLAGYIGCVNIKIPSPRFDSQSKTRLTSVEAKQIAYDAVYAIVKNWIRKNKEAAKAIVERAVTLSKLSNDTKLAKQLASAMNTKKGAKAMLPASLVISTTKNPEDRELTIVEGVSASGTARSASDRRFQEVLALRGKILNIERAEEKMKDSQAIIDLLKAIGYDPKAPDKPLRVGKILLLADPDADGSHIQALVLSVLWKVRPQLFEQGRVFNVNAPLFIYSTSTDKYHGSSMQDIAKQVKGKLDMTKVTRVKGYGEMQPKDLREIAFDPATRRLTRVLHPGSKAIEVAQAMGKDGTFRKALMGLT